MSCRGKIAQSLVISSRTLLHKAPLINIPCRYHQELLPRRNYLLTETVESYRKSALSKHPDLPPDAEGDDLPEKFRFVYPEFLPDPVWNRRDFVRERLERDDMYKRRTVLNIPDFYVGSILAVNMADKYSPNKENRFVGICIDRDGVGLRAFFVLRNVVDGLGVEIRYEMYDPIIQSIEVLKLEKRLDNQLYYLRDAPLEYSSFSFDMESEYRPHDFVVPTNELKVKLNPRPWYKRWEREELKGIQDLELPQRFYDRAKQVAKPWEKYDLMKMYRERINDEHSNQIFREVYQHRKSNKKKEN